MTAMTETDADHDAAGAPYWVCWDCGGPCASFKGSVHGWRCQSCIDRYLDDGAARWLARARKEQDRLREKISRNMLQSNSIQTPVTANGERREGGGSVLCAAPTAPALAGQERVVAPRYVPRRSNADDQLITREDT